MMGGARNIVYDAASFVIYNFKFNSYNGCIIKRAQVHLAVKNAKKIHKSPNPAGNPKMPFE